MEKKNKEFKEYKMRIECPDCHENRSSKLIELRHDYWECRVCGYNNDIDYWYKTKGYKHVY